jgi:hypothetical protein
VNYLKIQICFSEAMIHLRMGETVICRPPGTSKDGEGFFMFMKGTQLMASFQRETEFPLECDLTVQAGMDSEWFLVKEGGTS